ncbi:related to PDE2-high affinity 3`,5`-cyclic-nucleotide phosphodiesterase [Phialocephala subalpina]|uniref:Phosphodiesterase n=1 Tax=Phialocephala subalpina TaxID=576137 RepID=A0A1L7XSW0_9HELO|nr:related to PDE2-high affinity 3`,5`-cyclic-nucleotide phosphodiesterase [Phialocephala subalpina]
MDYAACNVVYVDRTAREDKLVKRDDATSAREDKGPGTADDYYAPVSNGPSPLDENLQVLLETFSEVHVCTSGKSCVSKLSELNQSSIVELIPTLVLIDIPYEDQLNERPGREIRTPSPSSQQIGLYDEERSKEAYGLKLLQWIASEIQYQSLSRLVVPVAVVSIPEHNSLPIISRERTDSESRKQFNYSFSSKKRAGLVKPLDQIRTVRYLDIGAVDVLTSPLLHERLPSLAIHAYRAHKDASKEQRALLEMKRGRKRSWVGVDDQKPYAYLREAMVSGLMDGICKVGGEDEPFGHVRISIALDRREKISAAVGSWNFSAHDFTDDELLHAALLMLQHALAMPELEKWRISTENLTGFLVASRSAYNAFVPYHNFRHVVDVLQACFHFLVRLRRLPPYPASNSSSDPPSSPIAQLIRPFDALTLLITAIGHDVGHPGVNNAFLVTLNAPLAQLYNDRSVLESFHCAAYSQILRRHWPAAFQGVEMRQLMINSILATDMGLHFDYMKKLGWLQDKLHENGGITDAWNGRLIEEQRTLACSLLIKCADISNVARKYDVAAQWTMILTDEFARQASMEQDLGIPSALFAAPVREVVELGKSQINFMNMFAIPLFQGVADVMPGMAFTVEELNSNKSAWAEKIAEEQAKARQDSEDSLMKDGMFSPRTMSVANPSDASHQKLGSATSLSPDSLDLRKALLSKPLSTPTNGVLDEAEPHHQSLPEISTSPVSLTDDSASPSEGSDHSRRTIKPSQLQLSFATASAPGLLDHPSQDTQVLSNGTHVNSFSVAPSLVTDAVVVDPPTPLEPKSQGFEGKRTERSSEGTENGSSSAGDWTSQATSATTGKMPLSPSTKGTSIMSDSESLSKDASQVLTPTASPNRTSTPNRLIRSSPCPSSSPTPCPRGSRDRDKSEGSSAGGEDGKEKEENKGIIVEKVKTLKKKPSRFRMNFWKRSKSSSPPMPVGGSRIGRSEDDDGSQ